MSGEQRERPLVMYQDADGDWMPAAPLPWLEEHGWLARLIFRLRGVPHCNDEANRRIARPTPDEKGQQQ